MENKGPQNASELLEMIYEFIYDDENKSAETIQNELKKEGINTDKLLREIDEKIKQFKAKGVLAKARKERKHFIEFNIRNIDVSTLKEYAVNKKDEFSSALEKICGLSKEDAAVYCRKFADGNIDDLNSLLEDFKLLSDLSKDKDVGQKN